MSERRWGIDWVGIDRAVGWNAALHPGEMLADWLEEAGESQTAFSRRLGVTDPYVCAFIKGHKNVGPSMALKLEARTGIRAEVWLHLQMMHTLESMRRAA